MPCLATVRALRVLRRLSRCASRQAIRSRLGRSKRNARCRAPWAVVRRVSLCAEELPALVWLVAQVVVVLSAMKMMNEIAALATGTVQSVAVTKDQQANAHAVQRANARERASCPPGTQPAWTPCMRCCYTQRTTCSGQRAGQRGRCAPRRARRARAGRGTPSLLLIFRTPAAASPQWHT